MLLPQQTDSLPQKRCDCEAKAAQERNRRAMETFQANINGCRKEDQPEQKEADDQNGATLSLLLPRAGIDQSHQPQPLEDAGGRNQRAGHEHRRIAPAGGNQQHEGGDQAQNQSVADSPLEHGLQSLLGEAKNGMRLFGHGSISEVPFPVSDLAPLLAPFLSSAEALTPATKTSRTTYTSPETPPKMIPARAIQDWCRRLSNQAPISQPIKAAEGNRKAICIIFSASTRLASALVGLLRGCSSGMWRLKGMEALSQHTVQTGKQVYFPFGPFSVRWKEMPTCSIRNLSAVSSTCARQNSKRSSSWVRQPIPTSSLLRTPFPKCAQNGPRRRPMHWKPTE